MLTISIALELKGGDQFSTESIEVWRQVLEAFKGDGSQIRELYDNRRSDKRFGNECVRYLRSRLRQVRRELGLYRWIPVGIRIKSLTFILKQDGSTVAMVDVIDGVVRWPRPEKE